MAREEVIKQLVTDMTTRGINVKVSWARVLDIQLTIPVKDIRMKVRMDGFEIVDNTANALIEYYMPLRHVNMVVNRSKYVVTNCDTSIDFDYHGRDRKITVRISVRGLPYTIDRFDA